MSNHKTRELDSTTMQAIAQASATLEKKKTRPPQMRTEQISDLELGKVLVLSGPAPEQLEEITTPEPSRDHDPHEEVTQDSSSHEDTSGSAASVKTTEWSQEDLAHLVQDIETPDPHHTEQISTNELQAMALSSTSTREVQGNRVKENKSHFNQVKTVQWEPPSLAGIVSEAEAAACLERSSVREDDAALLDVPEKQFTEEVDQARLDELMEEATARRPRQGKDIKPSPPAVALLEERMPDYMTRSPGGDYRSLSPSMVDVTHTVQQSHNPSLTLTHKLLITLIVLIVMSAVGAVLYLMWPKATSL